MRNQTSSPRHSPSPARHSPSASLPRPILKWRVKISGFCCAQMASMSERIMNHEGTTGWKGVPYVWTDSSRSFFNSHHSLFFRLWSLAKDAGKFRLQRIYAYAFLWHPQNLETLRFNIANLQFKTLNNKKQDQRLKCIQVPAHQPTCKPIAFKKLFAMDSWWIITMSLFDRQIALYTPSSDTFQ